MSEMFKKIINILLVENIDFKISKTGDHYTVYSLFYAGKLVLGIL